MPRNRGEQQQYPGQGLEMWSRILTGQEDTKAEKEAWKQDLLAAVDEKISKLFQNTQQQLNGMREENLYFRNGIISLLNDMQKEIDNKILNRCSLVEHLNTKAELEQKVSDLYSWTLSELEKKEDLVDINFFVDTENRQ